MQNLTDIVKIASINVKGLASYEKCIKIIELIKILK